MDIASANAFGNSLTVALGDGAGGFPLRTEYSVGALPLAVFAADLDGDGTDDVVYAGGRGVESRIGVMLSKGAAGFRTPTDYPTGGYPGALTGADLDGDGRTDLVTANYDGNSVSVFRGMPSGEFGTRTDYPVGNEPLSLGLEDFDGDGTVDLAVGNNYSGNSTITILKGNGQGGLFRRVDYPTDSFPGSLLAADLNHDTLVDLVCLSSSGRIKAFLNQNQGVFQPQDSIDVSGRPMHAAITDFRGRGDLGLVLVKAEGQERISFLRGDGKGHLGGEVGISVGEQSWVRSPVIADFNRDGVSDIAVANAEESVVSVLLGEVPAPPSLSITPPSFENALSIRITGQKRADLALEGSIDLVEWSRLILLPNPSGVVEVKDLIRSEQPKRFFRVVDPN